MGTIVTPVARRRYAVATCRSCLNATPPSSLRYWEICSRGRHCQTPRTTAFTAELRRPPRKRVCNHWRNRRRKSISCMRLWRLAYFPISDENRNCRARPAAVTLPCILCCDLTAHAVNNGGSAPQSPATLSEWFDLLMSNYKDDLIAVWGILYFVIFLGNRCLLPHHDFNSSRFVSEWRLWDMLALARAPYFVCWRKGPLGSGTRNCNR